MCACVRVRTRVLVCPAPSVPSVPSVPSHWNGCFQFLIAQLDTVALNASLVQFDEAILAEEYPNGFHRDSWVERIGIANEPSGTQWEWCFFIAIMQMLAISIGIVEPKRTPEMWGYLVSILLGAVF